MDMTLVNSVDYDALIRSDRISSRLYVDTSIFEEELEKIFYSGWVFVAHESEIPEIGSFVRRDVGSQPLIIARGLDSKVRAFHNVCPHRSAMVCHSKEGKGKVFSCPYHGWVFNLNGELVDTPRPEGYGNFFKKEEHNLSQVAELDCYRGFIFVKIKRGGVSLQEHLGPAHRLIDMACDMSPEGELELTAGWTKHRIGANWKTQPDNNGGDGYHVDFVHASFAAATDSQALELIKDNSPAVGRYWGNGHFELDFRSGYAARGRPFEWFGRLAPEKVPNYIAAMERRYGAEKARELFVKGPPHAIIFPNLFLGELNVVFYLPTSVTETVQYYTPMLLKGAPEINRRAIHQSEGAVSPASFLVPDDIVIAERLQVAASSIAPGWLDLTRGKHRESKDSAGMTICDMTDESTNRGFWNHYKDVMKGVSS